MNIEKLKNGYRQLSDFTYLDAILDQNKPLNLKKLTVYIVMNQINSNPEHIKIEGVFLDEDRARRIAQTFEFAWVDDHILSI